MHSFQNFIVRLIPNHPPPLETRIWKLVVRALPQTQTELCSNHNIAWEDSRIITTNNRYGQRFYLEAWPISASSCALNRDDGSYLPQEYLHLVVKSVDGVTLTVYEVSSFNTRSPLMKTLDRIQ